MPRIQPKAGTDGGTGNARRGTAEDHDSLVDFVVDRILEHVRDGHYSPGQRLIASDLAEELGVSRAPVREALHVMAGEGIVDLVPNRGARIRNFSAAQLADFLDFTNAVCSLGVYLTTQRIDDPAVREGITRVYQAIVDAGATRDPVRFVNRLYEFHREVNRLSGNEFIDNFYSRPAFAFFVRFLARSIPGAHWDKYLANYREIYDTILSGNPARAQKRFSSHLNWAKSLIDTSAG